MSSAYATPTPAKVVSRAIAYADSNLKKQLDEFYKEEEQHKVRQSSKKSQCYTPHRQPGSSLESKDSILDD
eukprot:8230336-Ditylum_brightwellii.AAC.1